MESAPESFAMNCQVGSILIGVQDFKRITVIDQQPSPGCSCRGFPFPEMLGNVLYFPWF